MGGSRAVALVPAAGRGERLGAATPKALVTIGGASMLEHAVRSLLRTGRIDTVVVAAPDEHQHECADVVGPLAADWRIVAGGADRTSSVHAALAAIEPGTFDVVLVHDAARPFVPADVVTGVIDAVDRGASAVVPVVELADTVKLVDSAGVITATPDRAALRAIQTPQGFAESVLRAAYAAGFDAATDDAGLVERLGKRVHTVPGHPDAMKITTPFDLAVAESVLIGGRS